MRLQLPLAAFVAVVGSALPTHAQQASTSPGLLAPASPAPSISRTPMGVALPAPTAAASGAPAGADAINLRLGDVVLTNGDPEIAEAAEREIVPLRGRTVKVSEVYEAAARIEAAYAKRGFFLTRVVVPPQTVRPGGQLIMRVVHGYVEAVDTSGLPPHVAARVAQLTTSVVGQRRLLLSSFERRLLLAAEVPGLTLRTVLTPGTEPGAVRLAFTGDHRVLTGDLTGDNAASRVLGTSSITASARLNSAFGYGEQFYAQVGGAPGFGFVTKDSPRRVFGGGFAMPIGIEGLVLNADALYSDTVPRVSPSQLPTRASFTRLSLRLSQPLVRTRLNTLVARLSFDATEERQVAPTFDNAPLYTDRTRALRLGLDWTRVVVDTGTLIAVGADLSRGIGGLGSRSPASAPALNPLSRLGARDDFAKLELRLRLVQQLGRGFGLELSGRAQRALSGPLLNAERFSLGGPRALSAFDTGAFVGDHGWLARAEMFYDAGALFAGVVTTPYLFAARGQVINVRPTAAEAKVLSANAIGLGARFAVPIEAARSAEIGVEAARQFDDNRLRPDEWRINVNASLRF
jgi:hemolysin activation/secretion protein